MLYRFIFLLFILLEPLTSDVLKYGLHTDSDINILSNHKIWHNLLYYHDGVSEIESKEFFLSSNGKTDPKAELIATINAYDANATYLSDDAPTCKYPARYMFLSQYVKFPNHVSIDSRCKRLSNWEAPKETKSISLMLVSGYLGNPASTFGHAFMRLNSDDNTTISELFDLSINYGALVPENEATLLYVMRGLFGGYQAGFSDKYFYTEDLVYSHNEFRDIWNYQLNLTEEQIQFLLLHLWEIIGKKYKYYFLDKNCGYRIAEMMQLIIDEPIIPQHRMNNWYIPLEMFQRLEDIDSDKRDTSQPPLIHSVTYVPSMQKELYAQYTLLDTKAQSIITDLIKNRLETLDILFQSCKDEAKIDILDFLLTYYRYQITNHPKDQSLTQLHRTLLLHRLQLPAQSIPKLEIPDRISPAKNNKPMIIGTGIGHTPLTKSYLVLNFSGYAMESLGQHNLGFDELVVLDTALGFNQRDELFIDKFDLVRIKKYKIKQHSFENDLPFSWDISISLEKDQTHFNQYHLLFAGGIGKSYKLFSKSMISLMLDSSINSSDSPLHLQPKLLLHHDFGKLKTLLQYSYDYEIKREDFIDIISLYGQYQISKEYAIQLQLQCDKELSSHLSLKWFF